MTKWQETEIGEIPGDWKIDKLGTLVEMVRGISYRSEDYCSEQEGLIFINLKCVGRNGGFREDGIKYYKGEVKQNQFVNEGDILISNTDLTQNREVIGAPIRVPLFARKACFSLDLTKLIPNNRVFKNFLYYYLLSPSARNFMINSGNGTTVVHLAISNIPNLSVPLPLLPEQKAIARILSDLDSKIEFNAKMNSTLEAVAQALFKHWFIDFEFPNEEGKPYESSGGEMVYNKELAKEIPKGWSVSEINKEFNLVMGQSPPGISYNENGKGVIFFQGRTDFGDRFPSIRIFCTKPSRFAKKGDTLISVRAPIGDTNLALKDCCIGRGLAAIRHKSNYSSYTYYLMKNLKSTFELFEAEGTVFGSLSKSDFEKIVVLTPSMKVIDKFESMIQKIDKKFESNTMQILTLSNIRDHLLPKLMLGRIRVPAGGS